MANNVEEIDADAHEEILERVGAIDVAKASGKVCVRVPGKQRRITKVWDVSATTNAIMSLGDELTEMGIERVVVESTSDYWRTFVRHEALFDRVEVKGLHLRAVAAV